MKAYALIVLAGLSGCVDPALIQQLDAAKAERQAAQGGWHQCVADPQCQGDEMAKKKATLEITEMDYAHACAAVLHGGGGGRCPDLSGPGVIVENAPSPAPVILPGPVILPAPPPAPFLTGP